MNLILMCLGFSINLSDPYYMDPYKHIHLIIQPDLYQKLGIMFPVLIFLYFSRLMMKGLPRSCSGSRRGVQPRRRQTEAAAPSGTQTGRNHNNIETLFIFSFQFFRWADIYEDMPMKRKIALYDYDPIELSPNVDSEVELAFRTGEILTIFGDMDDDGFFMGELGGRRGLVPSNFLTDLPPGYRASQGPRVLGQQRVSASPVTIGAPGGRQW